MDPCKRAFDFCLATVLIAAGFLPMLMIAALIRLNSDGPVLFWSNRIGHNNTRFRMPKFRTMRHGTPIVATHLLPEPDQFVTALGRWLRRSSLDELPQLLSVLKGDMSFVGPRPALFNQHDLIDLRSRFGIHHLVPGITGWAQINGRDELSIPAKVDYDRQYLEHRSLRMDFEILACTLLRVAGRQGISH